MKIDRTNRTVLIPVPFDFEWEYGVPIEKMKADIETVKSMGATHISVRSDQIYDDYYVKVEAYTERIETDIEVNNRIEEFSRRGQMEIDRAFKHYELTKQKYTTEV